MDVVTTPLLGWILGLPLAGALVNATLGTRLPRAFASWTANLALLAAFALSIVAVLRLMGDDVASLAWSAGTFMDAGGLRAGFDFQLDALSAVLLLIITGVGSLIHLYSAGYMADDPSIGRYFASLNLFVFAMLCLVLGANFPMLFLGWEGVGVASYLLIGFWFEDPDKASAGRKAFVTNRVGDLALLLGAFLLFGVTSTLDFASIEIFFSELSLAQLVTEDGPTRLSLLLTAIAVLFFIGCTGKSAQLPLHVWLPDAMAGPTPVSALIHAATMVTAGVYLIVRFGTLFAAAPWAMGLVVVTGAATALFAALIACTQNDIKKVLAYSTISQLGFMFVAVGAGSYFAGVFHLMTHAFFKALLFLGAGSVIHGLSGQQDIRSMGGLARVMPITSKTFLVGCAAIAGVPFVTSGFYSKDEILWFALSNQNVLGGPTSSALWGWGVWAVLLATATLTAFYMFRLYFLVFAGSYRGDDETLASAHESPRVMTVPLVVLAVLSVVGGFVGVPHILGGPIPTAWTDLHGWLEPVTRFGEQLHVNRFGGEGLAWLSMISATLASLGGIGLAWKFYAAPSDLPEQVRTRLGPLATAVERRFWVDEAYGFVFGTLLHLKARALYHLLDRVVIDGLVVEGAGFGARTLGEALRRFQSGYVQRYVAFAVLSLGVILFLLVR